MKTGMKVIIEGTRTKLLIALYILVSIAVGFLLIYGNDLLASLLNNHLMIQAFDGFATNMLLTTGVFVLIFGGNMLETYLLMDLKWGTINHLIGHYVARLLRVKQEFFTNLPASEVFANLHLSAVGSGEFFGNLLGLISRIIIFGFYGVVVFRLDLWAGIFTVLAMPLFFLFTATVGNQAAALEEAYLENEGELINVSQEALENARNVKAKGAYDFFANRSWKLLENLKKVAVKFGVYEQYLNHITGLFQILLPILIIFGAIQISPTFDENTGNVMVLFINIPLFLGSFSSIYKAFVNYQICKPFLQKLQEFENAPLEDHSGFDIDSFESLQTVGVKVTFGDKTINVPDFTIKAGERIMFFGESGVGKSTVFNILMGFIPDYEGDIFVNGKNLRDISLTSLRKTFGITFQQTNALTLDLSSNIHLGKKQSEEELSHLIKLTELEAQHGDKGDAILNNNVLSGGERSRLGLSQMIAGKPSVLLIDEAFSNLDEEMETKILGNLFDHYPDRTVVCISHRSASRPFFHRVVDFNV